MLRWAFSFLVLAIIAGFLGFGGVALMSADIARVLVTLFLVLFVIAAAVHVFHGRSPPI